MSLSHDTQPSPRTRDQILLGMHLMGTRIKPYEDVPSTASPMQAVANMDDKVTKTEARHD